MKKIIVTLLVSLSVFSIFPLLSNTCSGCDAPPESFEFVSPDRSKVFVFESTGEPLLGWNTSAAVYTYDEPRQLVYAVEQIIDYVFIDRIFFSDCFTYFALVHTHKNADQSVMFYSNGEMFHQVNRRNLIRYYQERDLHDIVWMNHIVLEDEREDNFNPATNQLTISTTEGNNFVFDITTGELVLGMFIRGLDGEQYGNDTHESPNNDNLNSDTGSTEEYVEFSRFNFGMIVAFAVIGASAICVIVLLAKNKRK